MGDLYISLKNTDVKTVTVNETHRIGIDGHYQFKPGFTGSGLLAMYFNLDLPPGGSPLRLAIANGGIRCWFQEVGSPPDDTGNIGPISPAAYGPAHFLMSHTWPHTVDEDRAWEFCYKVYALNKSNKPVNGSVQIETREIKIIANPTR